MISERDCAERSTSLWLAAEFWSARASTEGKAAGRARDRCTLAHAQATTVPPAVDRPGVLLADSAGTKPDTADWP